MKRKVKNKLLVVFLALLSLFLLAGCKLGMTYEEATKGLEVKVTYYANGGNFGTEKTEKTLFYNENTRPLEITESTPTSSGSIAVERDKYEFVSWHYAVLDAEGNPVYNAQTKLYELGEPVDFKIPLTAGDYYFVAEWKALTKVNVELVCGEGVEIPMATPVGEKEYYKNGETVASQYYNGQMQRPGTDLFKVKDNAYTLIEYYTDKACTTPVDFPLNAQAEDVTIYAKYIEGNWIVVSGASGVKEMFEEKEVLEEGKEPEISGKLTKRYYILNDINCSNLSSSLTPLQSFSGEIQGNGYTISGLKFSNSVGKNTVSAMFGNIESSAVIENVTFENVSVDYTVADMNGVARVYFVFASIAEAATVSNVNISGEMSVTVRGNVKVANLWDYTNGDWRYDNYNFGGYDTDEAYLKEAGEAAFAVKCTLDV